MNCRQFQRLYSAYRDGHDPALAAEMDDHLEACPRCAAFDRAVRDGVDVLRDAPVAPSPDFLPRLEARLASGETIPDPIPPRISPWAATAAAILFLTLVSFAVRNVSVLPTPVAAETPMVVAQPKVMPGVPFIAFERIR